jgi:hypothetical protein
MGSPKLTGPGMSAITSNWARHHTHGAFWARLVAEVAMISVDSHR